MSTQIDTEETTILAQHWIMVGYISDKAKEWITDCGGQVKQVNDEPTLYAVGIAYKPDGCWNWSKGKKQFRQGIEYWSSGELQEAATGITLLYQSWEKGNATAEYCSADTVYLICPDEEFDVATMQAKPVSVDTAVDRTLEHVMANTGDDGFLDDHPF